MSAPDRSWTISPTLAWFVGFVAVGLCVLDGGVQAVADRFATRHDAAPPVAGPVLTAGPAAARIDGDDADPTSEHVVPPVTAPAGPEGRAKVGALEDTCNDGKPEACKRWGMDGFYKAIAEEKAGKLGHAVRVSWYGDSVVATDAIPGRLRTRLQAELGDGGPGFVFAVVPHRFCGHEAITRSSSGDWMTHAISRVTIADGMYGVAGSTTQTSDGHATIKLVTGKVTQAELYYLADVKGGTAIVTADGAEVIRADTKADAKQAGWATAAITGGAAKFEISSQGRVRLFGLDLENASGAVVDNLGIVSVNVKSFATEDAAHWTAELAHRSADLVMIMIGANEAEWLGPGDRDTKDYQSHYDKILAPIRKARPDGACLVVSPTDQAEAKDGEYPSRPVMPILVEAQRKAAHAAGCAFYSTYDWMGARGSAAKWYRKGLVGSDFQHLSRKGANLMADAVFDALMTGFQRYGRP